MVVLGRASRDADSGCSASGPESSPRPPSLSLNLVVAACEDILYLWLATQVVPCDLPSGHVISMLADVGSRPADCQRDSESVVPWRAPARIHSEYLNNTQVISQWPIMV